jgi:glycosyltransferase involved in cell wall biosynthesis
MDNKKKLLIINGAQFGHSSGHYFYCKYLVKEFSIIYICYDRGLIRMVLDGVDVRYVSFKGRKIIRILRFLKECIRQSFSVKPHILLVTYFNLCFLLALFCRSKKTILDIRTGSLKKNSIFRSIDNKVILFQSIFFNSVIILSDSLLKKLHILRKKSNVVPLGSEIIFAGKHNFNSLNLLYIGTFDDRNIEITIKGLHLFLQNIEYNSIKIRYTIVGFGSENESLKIMKSISENKIIEFVKFEGRKNFEEFNPYFEQSNIGIVFIPQTPWYDCQPSTKLFEYLLSGMTVIATNTYENRLIVNKGNGVLVNDSPEDFCNGLISIYNQRNSFDSIKIRKSVESNTWESIININLKPFLEKSIK